MSPWFAFAVDLAATVLLGVSPPNSELTPTGSWTQWIRQAQPIVWTLIVMGMSLGLAAAGARWVFGSVDGAIAWLRNEPLSVSSGYVDFGSLHPSEARTVSAEVRNWSDRPVRLLGGTSDCSCVASLDLPLTVPPHGGRAVKIRLKVPQSEPGVFLRTVEIWTDDERQGTLRFQVGCRVE